MRFTATFLIAHISLAAFVAGNDISSVSSEMRDVAAECGSLGVMTDDLIPASLHNQEGFDPNELRKCRDHPLGTDDDLSNKRSNMAQLNPRRLNDDIVSRDAEKCWYGNPYGCTGGYCWKSCGVTGDGKWCWTAQNKGVGAWYTCVSDSDCGTTGYPCGVGCAKCGYSC